MLIILKFLFHFICSIGRCFRKIFQVILGRRHEEVGIPLSKTEPVTLEDIRVINEMENDSQHHYQSFTTLQKTPQAEWNSWGADDIFRLKQNSNNQSNAEAPGEQVDYFSNMAAMVKNTPKIILKKRMNDNDNYLNPNDQRHNRLQMSSDIPTDFQSGLSEWQDESVTNVQQEMGIWGNNIDLDELSHEADEALRETRRVEREKKLREHQQRRLQKEMSKTSAHKRDGLS